MPTAGNIRNDVKKNFRGDHTAEFKRLDDKRAKRKREKLKNE
jgi:hypothetical protein